MNDKKERLYGFDNLKFLLIFSVVLGHFLEISTAFTGSDYFLRVIYSFHMPAFLFVTGWFAKFRPKKIVLHLIYPYLLFQLLYLLFNHRFLGSTNTDIYFSLPYWLLWYLFATIIYHLLLPFFDVSTLRKKAAVLLLAVIAALFAGNDRHLGYGLSASRIVVFLPFFLLGFYCGKENYIPLAGKSRSLRIGVGIGASAAVLAVGIFLYRNQTLTVNMMYGSLPYETKNCLYSAGDRALLLLIALIWLIFLMTVLFPLLNRKIPVISTLGKNTFPIFLLHGFIVRYIGHYGTPVTVDSLPIVLLLTAAVILLCGNPITAWIFRRFFTGQWLELLSEKPKKKPIVHKK